MFYKNDKINDDFSKDNDYFNGQEYANEIVEALKSDDIKSIGLYGKWGIGKTSITENAIKIAIKEKIYEEKNIIKYNAWKYNKYDFMRDFLIECSKQIESEDVAKLKEYSYYNDRTEETHITKMLWKAFIKFLKESWLFFFFCVLLFLIFVGLILYINYLYPSLYECEDILVPVVIAFISFILPLFVVNNVSYKNISKKFSPEQFSRDFDTITNGKKILIFIDDIDRCSSEEIKDTFDILKTFILSKNNSIKFIIPIDPNVLYSTLGDKTYDYFSKIIDYPIIIKKYETFDFDELKKGVMEEINSKYTSIINDGIYLASKYYIDTPRKFKKFVNQFVNEIYKYEPRTIRQKGAMFSKLIILKNEFPLYYESLISNYKLTIRVSNEMIADYNSDKIIDIDSIKKGVKFDKKLLEFLSKTSGVDLYDFALFESNMSYDKYKIKLLCEAPVERNAFDDDGRIDLAKNIEFLEYELINNVINPINNNQFLYANLFGTICFLFNQFDNQINHTKARKLLEKIQPERIKADRAFLHHTLPNEKSKISWSYIIQGLKIYNYVKGKKSDDFIFKCVIDFIYEHKELITDDFENLFEFINSFTDEKNIENERLICLINLLLEHDFNRYSSMLDWHFNNNWKFDNFNYLSSIINYMFNNGESDYLVRYIKNKYTKTNSNELLHAVIEQSNLILQKLGTYTEIINHLIKIVNLKKENFGEIVNFLYTLRFDSSNSTINNLVYKIIRGLKSTNGFDENTYISVICEFGKNYDRSTINLSMMQSLINNSNVEERNSLLDYDSDLDIFKNYRVIKDGITIDSSKKSIKTLINTYKHYENKVYKKSLDNNGIDLSTFPPKDIFEIVNSDINKLIYVISEDNSDIVNININDLDFDTLEYEKIQNQKIIKALVDYLVRELNYISVMILGNNDENEVQNYLNKYLKILNHIIVDLNYTDKEIMKNFKTIERHMITFDLYNTVLISELKKYEQLIIKLMSDANYKSRNKNYERLLETVNN